MKKIYVFMLLLIAVTSCHSISSDPTKGADELCLDLQLFTEKNDYENANKILSEYLGVYHDQDSITFLLALRGNLMTNDNIVNFIADADFHKYPMFGNTLKALLQVAFADAINNPNADSPASKGIMFGVIMADFAKENNTEAACNTIAQTYRSLLHTTEMSRIEFFTSFKQFMQTSGEAGQLAFQFLNKLNSPEYTSFQRMALKSLIDYDN